MFLKLGRNKLAKQIYHNIKGQHSLILESTKCQSGPQPLPEHGHAPELLMLTRFENKTTNDKYSDSSNIS